jgi:DEAD/DEAH box helicase domain-containing protein
MSQRQSEICNPKLAIPLTPTSFLAHLQTETHYRAQLVHVEHLHARGAKFARPAKLFAPELERALRNSGIEKFYTHQARAIDLAREGYNVVVSTGTASGKTLCYNVPVLDAILQEVRTRAFYLFPTKALAQDQLRALAELEKGLGHKPSPAWFGTYDGDTPKGERNKLRKHARIILTNPDMLSLGILPNHNFWATFLANLKFVVIDEAHVYRGVFGSQVACVLRRLRRVCEFYGARPQFIFCSATIANAREHTERLIGAETVEVSDDGAPRGAKEFALWNPPFIDQAHTARRSPNYEAAQIFATLVRAGMRNITFAPARKIAELILLYARDQLRKTEPALADRIRAYRAGYLADERREIERALFDGKLLGVTATNALELGIDIGHLDATVLVGFPGTMASLWQQAGRAGRGTKETLSILIGRDGPLDQYFMRHPEILFSKSPEHALIDPDNPYILEMHLPCAAYELPLTNADEALFGPGFVEAMIRLERAGVLQYRGERWYYTRVGYPAEQVSLRAASDKRITLVDTSRAQRTLEEIDAATALGRVHRGAIYLHQGETYLVTRLDLDAGMAYLRPVDADYYTEPREVSDLRIVKSAQHRAVAGNAVAYFGRVRVTEQIVGFKRKRVFSEEVLSQEDLNYPPEEFETQALWWDLPPEIIRALQSKDFDLPGTLHAVEHACIGVLPLFAMCDRWDIGGLSTPAHPDTGQPQIFIYDGFPGGIGIAETGFTLLDELWRATLAVIEECPCESGCPSCVQSPKCGNNNEPLDKAGAVFLLRRLVHDGRPRIESRTNTVAWHTND